MTTHSVVSYFCGCGGLDLGFRGGFDYHGQHYKKNPFRFLAAYDDPLNPHLIDPLYLFLSSKFEMQAVGMKNRTSLHSI